jgi:hypothetical protein
VTSAGSVSGESGSYKRINVRDAGNGFAKIVGSSIFIGEEEEKTNN